MKLGKTFIHKNAKDLAIPNLNIYDDENTIGNADRTMLMKINIRKIHGL